MNQKIINIVLLAVFAIALGGCSPQNKSENETEQLRIVSVGGSATEIVYALGAEQNLVGTDTSSVYPEAATKLPQVGYQRTLSAEGVLSLKPSLLIVLPEAGPPTAIQQIENAGIKVLKINNESTLEGTKTKIRQVAQILNRKEKGEEIIKKLENDLAEAEKLAAAKNTKPKVVFIFSRGAGTTQVGGINTPADAMIKMAGGINAVTEFAEYKPLTPEAMVKAQPDVILLPTRALMAIGGIDSVLSLPGVAETPAGKNKRIITIDDMLLLGFTPRLGIGVKELCEKIHQ
ncbi:MAG: hemin ABC transporter substrate-binding protein [Blastocatellia bacterium]|nr:hemin ABC transporter substrate-binding protein [Blastocatellia bacterium]